MILTNTHKVGLVTLAVLIAAPFPVAVNVSPSLPQTLFLLNHYGVTDENLKRGAYVRTEKFSSKYLLSGIPVRMLKRIACAPGDRLEVIGKLYVCNGLALGYAKLESSKGELVDKFEFSGRVPQGKWFLMGTHPDSFDSRYVGFWEIENIEALAYPLF